LLNHEFTVINTGHIPDPFSIEVFTKSGVATTCHEDVVAAILFLDAVFSDLWDEEARKFVE
jgi:hypothetical protein